LNTYYQGEVVSTRSHLKDTHTKHDVDSILVQLLQNDALLLQVAHTLCQERSKKKRKKGAPSKGKSNLDVKIDSTTRKRRESWLGDDVGITTRKMRRDFFVCNLAPGKEEPSDEKNHQQENANLSRILKRWHLWTDASFEEPGWATKILRSAQKQSKKDNKKDT